ncbi:hypothetical protein KBY97_09110 [Synechococcus sp. ATX 2A4]|uniref:hypothetical protein n=1 Tax=Synechococcus sp. ATX 2A4 TaxID=2823727 RepID=UPI0020CEBD2B|nr:hypothetical protein [Synechococcus sp. ATX 2A4]MCP9885281.1 hypothetical protein [Synechococcus sp. ATX 2A4]
MASDLLISPLMASGCSCRCPGALDGPELVAELRALGRGYSVKDAALREVSADVVIERGLPDGLPDGW